jgi:hypothetical protein
LQCLSPQQHAVVWIELTDRKPRIEGSTRMLTLTSADLTRA